MNQEEVSNLRDKSNYDNKYNINYENKYKEKYNERYNEKCNEINNNEHSKNLIDEFIHFKKRKSYKYSSYFSNFSQRKMNEKYFDYNINSISENKNYPELNINLNDLTGIDSNINYNLNLKIQNGELNKPITSYGIVLYTYEKNKYLKYLVCQRRDSISYIQYLQDLIDEQNILKYINLMSKEEKKRCLEFYYKNDPYTIWKDLWINNRSKIYVNDYHRCTNVFLKNMEKYIEYFKDDSVGQTENPWVFPKGRMQNGETEIECAMREFEEETNISRKNISVNKNVSFEEIYIGSNNLIYKAVYYIAYIPYIPKKIYKYYPNNIRKKFISSEIYDMEWLEYQSAIDRLNNTKKSVLSKINNYILKKKF